MKKVVLPIFLALLIVLGLYQGRANKLEIIIRMYLQLVMESLQSRFLSQEQAS